MLFRVENAVSSVMKRLRSLVVLIGLVPIIAICRMISVSLWKVLAATSSKNNKKPLKEMGSWINRRQTRELFDIDMCSKYRVKIVVHA